MALLFIDGFDVADPTLKWQSAGIISSTTVTRYGYGRSAYLQNYNAYAQKLITPSSQVFIGMGVRFDSYSNINTSFLTVYTDTGATMQLNLYYSATGTLTLRRGTTSLASTGAVITLGAWHYIEMSATIADAGGRGVVRVDGVTVIDFTGDTRNAGTSTNIDMVRISGISNYQNDTYFDDFYLCNSTGTTNNTFLGDVRVQVMTPTGAGASTQLTPTGVANNWDNVNDIPPVTTTYNASATSGLRDTYVMSDLIAAPTTVLGVQTSATMKKLDAGFVNMKPALKSGASVYYGATQSLIASPLLYTDIYENNPATSAAWTSSEVNSIEFGAEVA